MTASRLSFLRVLVACVSLLAAVLLAAVGPGTGVAHAAAGAAPTAGSPVVSCKPEQAARTSAQATYARRAASEKRAASTVKVLTKRYEAARTAAAKGKLRAQLATARAQQKRATALTRQAATSVRSAKGVVTGCFADLQDDVVAALCSVAVALGQPESACADLRALPTLPLPAPGQVGALQPVCDALTALQPLCDVTAAVAAGSRVLVTVGDAVTGLVGLLAQLPPDELLEVLRAAGVPGLPASV